MFRPFIIVSTVLFLTPATIATVQAENNFLDQYRFNKKFDDPKYTRYKQRSRNINNFGESSSRNFGTNNGSGLYFESERIRQPGTISIKREDQNTQIKLKIRF